MHRHSYTPHAHIHSIHALHEHSYTPRTYIHTQTFIHSTCTHTLHSYTPTPRTFIHCTYIHILYIHSYTPTSRTFIYSTLYMVIYKLYLGLLELTTELCCFFSFFKILETPKCRKCRNY